MQFHHVQNLPNKDSIFHGFLSAQQQKLKFFVTSSSDLLLIFWIKHKKNLKGLWTVPMWINSPGHDADAWEAAESCFSRNNVFYGPHVYSNSCFIITKHIVYMVCVKSSHIRVKKRSLSRFFLLGLELDLGKTNRQFKANTFPFYIISN